MVVYEFDPWRSELCTCGRKYSLNPYTGCAHACVYCYITSYIPRAFSPRLKKGLLKRLRAALPRMSRSIPVSIANSSDPYQPLEREHRQTLACLKLLRDFRVMLVTKGTLVQRDVHLLAEMQAAVAVTITTLDEGTARRLEPKAPPPEQRLRALQVLAEHGVPTICRIDPVIPGINDSFSELVRELACAGVRHVTSSTFKPRPDSWRRFADAFPEHAERLGELYFRRGERVQNSRYLPLELRRRLMLELREECLRRGMSFGTCREALGMPMPSCDGMHLIRAGGARPES
ncbi:MAG: radical SAM protein [Euryarchaeota archaeon]|nr:radical SAM protein [Euryarchaeota archaeon]